MAFNTIERQDDYSRLTEILSEIERMVNDTEQPVIRQKHIAELDYQEFLDIILKCVDIDFDILDDITGTMEHHIMLHCHSCQIVRLNIRCIIK